MSGSPLKDKKKIERISRLSTEFNDLVENKKKMKTEELKSNEGEEESKNMSENHSS